MFGCVHDQLSVCSAARMIFCGLISYIDEGGLSSICVNFHKFIVVEVALTDEKILDFIWLAA